MVERPKRRQGLPRFPHWRHLHRPMEKRSFRFRHLHFPRRIAMGQPRLLIMGSHKLVAKRRLVGWRGALRLLALTTLTSVCSPSLPLPSFCHTLLSSRPAFTSMIFQVTRLAIFFFGPHPGVTWPDSSRLQQTQWHVMLTDWWFTFHPLLNMEQFTNESSLPSLFLPLLPLRISTDCNTSRRYGKQIIYQPTCPNYLHLPPSNLLSYFIYTPPPPSPHPLSPPSLSLPFPLPATFKDVYTSDMTRHHYIIVA